MSSIDDWLAVQSTTKHSKIAQKKTKGPIRPRPSTAILSSSFDLVDQPSHASAHPQDPEEAIERAEEVVEKEEVEPQEDMHQQQKHLENDEGEEQREEEGDEDDEDEQDSDTDLATAIANTLEKRETVAVNRGDQRDHMWYVQTGEDLFSDPSMDALEDEFQRLERDVLGSSPRQEQKKDKKKKTKKTATTKMITDTNASYGGDSVENLDNDLFELMGTGTGTGIGNLTPSARVGDDMADISAYIAKSRAERQKPASLFD